MIGATAPGKNASGSTLETSTPSENAHTSGSLHNVPALALSVTETSYGKVKLLVFDHFKQPCSNADFNFDFNVRKLTAEAL